jgi:hypothetical protein
MSKQVLIPQIALNAVSMASNQVSASFPTQYVDNLGIQLVWSGASPGGSIRIQVSMDQVTWISLQTMPGTDLVISPGGSAGNAYVDVTQTTAPHMRVNYTTAGGSVGSLTAMVSFKGLQG